MVQKIGLTDIFFGLSCWCQAIITNFYIFKCKMVLIRPFIMHENAPFVIYYFKKFSGTHNRFHSSGRLAAAARQMFGPSSKSHLPLTGSVQIHHCSWLLKRTAGGEAERSSKTDQRGNRKSNNSIKTGKPADIFAFRALWSLVIKC